MQKSVALLIAMALCQSSAWAGSITWIADVTIQHSFDYPFDVTTSITPVATDRADIVDTTDGRYFGGFQDWALVDVQGTGSSLTVYFASAMWNFDQSFTAFGVPLYVYSYPSSPTPPTQFDDSKARFLSYADIPVGTNTGSITLNGINAGDGTCFLFETQSEVVFGPACISLGFSPPGDPPGDPQATVLAVPEPISIVTMALGLTMAGVVLRVFK